MARKKKRKNTPHTVGNYRLVKMVDITEDDLEYVGELYRSKQGVYFMVPVNRIRTTEIKASEYGDLERRVEALVAKQFEAYRKENEERWEKYFGTQNLTSTQKDPQNSAKENQPLIYKIVDERVKATVEPLTQRVEKLENDVSEIRKLINGLYSKMDELPSKIKEIITPQSPGRELQPATALEENVYTSTPSQPFTLAQLSTRKPIGESRGVRASVDELERILDKYKLPQWTREMYESPFEDIYHRIWKYYDEIKSNYRPLLKDIIELARRKNMDPKEYAAFIMASLDEKLLKVEVPGLQLTEAELHIIDML